MYATDFEYDGLALSDFGMMISSFNSPGAETVSSGADIRFHTVRPAGSDRFHFYGANYEECFCATLQISKSPCAMDRLCLSPEELSALQRWLCRKDGYHRLHFLSESYTDIYWNAIFSSRQINVFGYAAGLELTVYTDAPYAYRKEQTTTWNLRPGESFSLYDTSDEVGAIYPLTVITSMAVGELCLSNSMEPHLPPLKIKGLSSGEAVTLDGRNKVISSNKEHLRLPSDFNYHFPRIINKLGQRENVFTLSQSSPPCTVSFTYSPIVKTGI